MCDTPKDVYIHVKRLTFIPEIPMYKGISRKENLYQIGGVTYDGHGSVRQIKD